LAGNRDQRGSHQNVGQDGKRTGTARPPAICFRIPIKEKAQILCNLRLFYGFHPDTRD